MNKILGLVISLSTHLLTKSATVHRQIPDFVWTVAEQIQHDLELFVTRPHLQLVYEQLQNFVDTSSRVCLQMCTKPYSRIKVYIIKDTYETKPLLKEMSPNIWQTII